MGQRKVGGKKKVGKNNERTMNEAQDSRGKCTISQTRVVNCFGGRSEKASKTDCRETQ